MVVSILLTAFITPFLFLIVRYEREKQNRTLINQLVASLLHVITTPNIILQVMFIIRYSVGAFPHFFCYLDLLARPGFVTFQLLILDAICIIRYIFVFHLKNPTATQADFWSLYILLCLFGFSVISHGVFIFLPGNNPNYFYICLGEIPPNHSYTETKFNWVLSIVLFLTVVAHILVAVRYQIYRYQEKKQITVSFLTFQTVTQSNINKASMASFSTNVLGVFCILFTSVVPQRINNIDLQMFNTYPHYIWIYFFYFYIPPVFQIGAVLILLTKSQTLRNYLKFKINERFG